MGLPHSQKPTSCVGVRQTDYNSPQKHCSAFADMQRVDSIQLLYEVKRTGCAYFHRAVMYCYLTDWLLHLPSSVGLYACVVGSNCRGTYNRVGYC